MTSLRDIIEHNILDALGLIGKTAIAVVLIGGVVMALNGSRNSLLARWNPHVGSVTIAGVIAGSAPANADRLIKALRAAYENPQLRALVLAIDSPGGSPVQAERIHDALLKLKQDHISIPVVAVIGDVGAAAAYYIAVAADTIYASKASLVGSIGERLDSFGITNALRNAGIERRLSVAGEHKGALDRFSPVHQDEQAHLYATIGQVHRQFIGAIKAGRGERLKADPRLLSDSFWVGEDARALGLVDALGDRQVVMDALHLDQVVDYTSSSLVDTFGGGLAASVGLALPEWLGGWAPR